MNLAWKLALRELRGGVKDFRIFIGCLMIGVAVIAAVTSVSEQISAGIRQESRTLLGGDLQLSLINQPMAEPALAYLRKAGNVSLTISMRSMAMNGDEVTLVELKGVDEAYPLLGAATLASGEALQDVLGRGEVVAEPALMERLLLQKGGELRIGDAYFPMSTALEREPDRVNSSLTLGPRVMGRIEVLQSKGLLMPAGLTRFNYHVLLHDGVKTSTFLTELKTAFPDAPWIVKTVNENNRGVQDFIKRLQLFMTLAGLSTLLIGGIGIMNAAEGYLGKKAETIAVLKTLGASRALAFGIYMRILLIITVAGSVVGALVGTALSHVALPYLSQFLPVFDSEFRLNGYAIGLSVAFGVLTVLTFSIASLGKGIEVRPALLFRGMDTDKVRLPRSKKILNALLACTLTGTLILTSSDRGIAAGFIACAIGSLIIFTLSTRAVQRLARHIRPRAPWARMAVTNLYRPGSHTLSIMLSTGIGLTVLIALLQVEGNFQREVKETIPSAAPSLFLIDINKTQKDDLLNLLHANDALSDIAYQPMVRGRIAKANGVPVENLAIADDVKWAVESDRGLTYAATPPANAVIVEGEWWPKDYSGKTLISMDRKLAKGMGLRLGDRVSVNVLGEEIEGEIASLRDVNYISFQINFSLILSPGALEHLPATFIATLRASDLISESALVRQLARSYPNISAIRIKDSIDQISEMVSHIALALRLCAMVTVLAGVLVLASAMAAMLDKRVYDMVLLKVLGARRADIVAMFLTEWVLLALLTSGISCVLGILGARLILMRMDWVQFQIIPSAVGGTVALALLCVTLTGWLIHTRIFGMRASTILRNE